jgi:hypothetical protein
VVSLVALVKPTRKEESRKQKKNKVKNENENTETSREERKGTEYP